MQVLYNLAIQVVPYESGRNNMLLKIYNYFKGKYDELTWKGSKTKITKRMGYIKKMIEGDIKKPDNG